MDKVDPTELRNSEIHHRVAVAIRRDLTLIDRARERLARWLASDGNDPALVEWQDALDQLDPEELAVFLESPTPRAKRMRISSPFFGLA